MAEWFRALSLDVQSLSVRPSCFRVATDSLWKVDGFTAESLVCPVTLIGKLYIIEIFWKAIKPKSENKTF